MESITKKSEIYIHLDNALAYYHADKISGLISFLRDNILNKKVKFPLLEHCGHFLFERVPGSKHIAICDGIHKLRTIGGNVIIGIILQDRLAKHYPESLEQAAKYISEANEWYVCDIIGERVFGFALLNHPQKTIIQIRELSTHTSTWVVRSLGAGIHYAVKKGLSTNAILPVFKILMAHARSKDRHIRQGIGWAAKTIAKFHPDIIKDLQEDIQDKELVENWFRNKIKIGLMRSKQ